MMYKANVYDMAGKQVGEIDLPDSVFGIEPNKYAMHAAVVNHLANRRQGTQSTLTRAEVSGGGIKPWRQKGTGRARQGSIRAPQWTHGGISLGPKPRVYNYEINKKTRRLALLSALSSKAMDGEIAVIRGLELAEIKTKPVKALLSAVGAGAKALVITLKPDEKVIKSARNLPGVKTTFADILCVYDVANGGRLVIDEAAISRIQEVYAK